MATSKKLAKVVEFIESVRVGKTTAASLRYTMPQSNDPKKEYTSNVLHNFLKTNTKLGDKLVALKPGDEICVVKEQQGEYWNLIDILDKSEVPPPRQEYSKPYGGGNRKADSGTNYSAKLGGLVHDAMAWSIHNAGKNEVKIEDIENKLDQLIELSLRKDKEISNKDKQKVEPAAAAEAAPEVQVEDVTNSKKPWSV